MKRGVVLKIKVTGLPRTQFQVERNEHESEYEADIVVT
jgi:hypothetical protein